MEISDFFRIFTPINIKDMNNIVESLLVFCFVATVLSLLALLVLWVVQFCTEQYCMSSAMKELKKRCETKDGTIKKLYEIKNKMLDCPRITFSISAIEVADFGDLKLLIAGDNNGKPRLFAFNTSAYSRSDYHKLRNTDNFKKSGLKHSLSDDELSEFLKEVSKVTFKKKLEEQLRKNVIDHFNK